MKTAFVFPGQGAQYVGMAQDFISADPSLAAYLKDFDEKHDVALSQAMAAGPEELLKQTHLTQPAILFHSIVALKAFEKRYTIRPDFVAGHSLGEFSALVAAGSLTLEDAMFLVNKRGEFMIKAVGDTPFAMAAVIGLDSEKIDAICREASQSDLVMAVNFNTPVQTVISGSQNGVAKAGELLKAAGAKRILPLVVGGPFHTPLIQKSSAWLIEVMQDIVFKDASVPLVSNLDAAASVSGAEAKIKLGQQIISPVRWVQSVEYMIERGVKRFIEFGPQKVLSGMIGKINKEVSCYNIDGLEDLEALAAKLEA